MRKFFLNLIFSLAIGFTMLDAGIKITDWQYYVVYALVLATSVNMVY
jgi:hypothetical protein